MERAQKQRILSDLQEKMVFLAGPRQSGKTTLSKQLFPAARYQYLSYDRAEDRRLILKMQWGRDHELVILDEFHKHPAWKTFLKGYYDTEGNSPRILVTGSAKMDVFRKGNDSLAGRYYYHRLLPLSVRELAPRLPAREALENLLRYGNFPEPFSKSSETARKRWQHLYLEKLVREDVTDLSNVKSLPKIQLLIDGLRERVGNTVSYASLARDLEVAPKTVKEWIDLLEQLYIVFRVTPYSKNVMRSLLKEPKIYFFDCTMAFDPAAHLENLVAVSLVKSLWSRQDVEGVQCALHYLRTKDGGEVDFLTVVDRRPELMVEVKNADQAYHKPFDIFRKFLPGVSACQIVKELPRTLDVNGVAIRRAADFLGGLSL